MDPLEEYRQKRDFRETPEPRGSATTKENKRELVFVIQKHWATRLHYDLRLEFNGVLMSWAVPREPEPDPSLRRLAVRTEDHPMEYATFEGEIPEPGYGAGHVEIWDKGVWVPNVPVEEALEKGDLKFELFGERLTGNWGLVRIRGRDGRKEKQDTWLLIKKRDPVAKGGTQRSGTIEQRTAPDPSRVEGARKVRFPATSHVQLATSEDVPPSGAGWLHEPKLDGYRLLCEIRPETIALITRSGLDWTGRFPGLPAALRSLPCREAVLDAEAVVFDSQGISDFSRLQRAIADGHDIISLVAFDLLYLDGWDLSKSPLSDRKMLLKQLLEHAPAMIRYGDHFVGDGRAFFRQACELGLEGVVSKRADEPYRSGRGDDWRKAKCRLDEEFVIIGFTEGSGTRAGFGALLLASRDDAGSDLRYVGRVGTGFDQRTLKELAARLKNIERADSPTGSTPAGQNGREIHWVEPVLVASVQFAGWTADRILRHASFRGLREDKSAGEIVMEPSARKKQKQSPRTNVTITSPEKVIFPAEGVTKQNLVDYWTVVAPFALPWIGHRPLSLLRCPGGVTEECFYQKHIAEGFPESVGRVPVNAEGDLYAMVDDLDGLLGLVQMNVIEVHIWGSTEEHLDKPDTIVFDLDPAENVSWDAVVDAALDLKERLEGLGLTPFPKVTGGKGIHLMVPVFPGPDWPAIKQFARAVAREMESDHPYKYTTNMAKAKRVDKVFIDYLRNDREATSIAPYSPRARDGATVALPVTWSEIESSRLKQLIITVRNASSWLESHPHDQWKAYNAARARLTG